MSSIIISAIVTVILGIIGNYIFLPAFTLAGIELWGFIWCMLCIFCVCLSIGLYIQDEESTLKCLKYSGVTLGIFTAVLLVVALTGSPLFNAHTYANNIKVEESPVSEIPTVDNLSQIPLMDTDSARKLGDRTVGSLTDVVSQYNVSSLYTTITYQGRVYKIAPLEYAGFFKYNANKYNGIPGYVLVDTENNSAEYVELEEGFKISTSAFFGNDLTRTLRRQYGNLIFGNGTFQIDEEGAPYWVVTVMEPTATFCGLVPKGTIVLNAQTGASDYYNLTDTPEWVDYAIDGDLVSKMYNWYGGYQSGFWNLLTSQKGVTQVTQDFGYISKDNDIWVYTGVTSVNMDESNLGFIMVNSRTGDFYYIPCDGAEEYSAMSAAEGAVQNYGYVASFPALITIEEEPTYALVLKDANGLIKQYAFINVKNYTLVANATTLEKAHQNYLALLNGEVVEDVPEATEPALNTPAEEPKEPEVTVTEENALRYELVVERVEYAMEDGNTYVYIISGGTAYKMPLSQNEEVLFADSGYVVELLAIDDGTNILDASFVRVVFMNEN